MASKRPCELRNVRPVKELKNRIIRMPNGGDYLSNVVQVSEGMSGSGRQDREERVVRRDTEGREGRRGWFQAAVTRRCRR